MKDEELDLLLARSAPTPPDEAVRTAVLMARDSTAPRRPPSRWRRFGKIAGVSAGGALLIAAGTTAAYQLSIPPFVTVDAGTVRIGGIPVEYTNSLGRRVDCLAYMDFRNIDDAQRGKLRGVAKSPEWSGYGDRVLDQLNIPEASPEAQNEAIFDVVQSDLVQRARQAVPEMVVFEQESSAPDYHGTALSCAKAGGVDGRP